MSSKIPIRINLFRKTIERGAIGSLFLAQGEGETGGRETGLGHVLMSREHMDVRSDEYTEVPML